MEVYPPATDQSGDQWKIITKTCIRCGKPFECRSTARRTQWCFECSDTIHNHAVAYWLRREVIKRDGYRCRYCGKQIERNELRFDHVFPHSLGGLTCMENLVVSCHGCNSHKAAKTLEQAGMVLREIE